jgi:hypothetical protein
MKMTARTGPSFDPPPDALVGLPDATDNNALPHLPQVNVPDRPISVEWRLS